MSRNCAGPWRARSGRLPTWARPDAYYRRLQVAAAAANNCAMMNTGASEGRIPPNVSVADTSERHRRIRERRRGREPVRGRDV